VAWVSILAVIILILSFLGGAKGGAVKQFFSLAIFLVAIPLAGISYRLVALVLSFLPGNNWENFIGFFITLGLISVILHFIVWIPRRIARAIWKKGLFFRLIGGTLNVFQAGTGMVVFTLVIAAYPVFDWLGRAVVGSGVLIWLVERFSFVAGMLPEVFRSAALAVSTHSSLG
jgi:uncharacterized membrane protein required for colicin V production